MVLVAPEDTCDAGLGYAGKRVSEAVHASWEVAEGEARLVRCGQGEAAFVVHVEQLDSNAETLGFLRRRFPLGELEPEMGSSPEPWEPACNPAQNVVSARQALDLACGDENTAFELLTGWKRRGHINFVHYAWALRDAGGTMSKPI